MTLESNLTHTLLLRRKGPEFFFWMLVISSLGHVVFLLLLVLPGRYLPLVSEPIYLDLQALSFDPASNEPVPQEATVPTSATAPIPVEAPAMSDLPRTEGLREEVRQSLRRGTMEPEAVQKSSIGLGMITGYFGSFAQGETLKDEIRVYYFSLMRRVNEAWWLGSGQKPSGLRGASINLVINREGKISSIEMLESTGNNDVDRFLMDSLKKGEPFPPLPNSYPKQLFVAPIRFIPPLNLMLPGLTGKTPPGSAHR